LPLSEKCFIHTLSFKSISLILLAKKLKIISYQMLPKMDCLCCYTNHCMEDTLCQSLKMRKVNCTKKWKQNTALGFVYISDNSRPYKIYVHRNESLSQ